MSEVWRLVDAWDVVQEWVETPTGGGSQQKDLLFERSDDLAIGLKIVNEDGAPIVGAKGNLVMFREGSPVPWRDTLSSDAQGVMWYGDMEYGGWWLDVQKKGFVPCRVCPGQGPADYPGLQTLVLERGRSLRGNVRTISGSAVVGAWVKVQWDYMGLIDGGLWFTQTDVAGRFTVTVPCEGNFRIATGAAPYWAHGEAGQSLELELEFREE